MENSITLCIVQQDNNMRKPIIKDVGGLHILLLLHALIPCLAAYILPS